MVRTLPSATTYCPSTKTSHTASQAMAQSALRITIVLTASLLSQPAGAHSGSRRHVRPAIECQLLGGTEARYVLLRHTERAFCISARYIRDRTQLYDGATDAFLTSALHPIF
jgi:hypothetical protein